MVSSTSTLLFFSISVTFLILTTSQLSPQNDMLSFCIDNYGNYTANSAYKTNLGTIFSSFSSLSLAQFHGGFYNFSAGADPDRVNALALCRGDLQASDCYRCLHSLRTDLLRQCPDQREAIGWYQHCMFRYSARSIFGLLDNGSKIVSASNENATSTSDTIEFERVVGELVTKLVGLAASGSAIRKFSTGSASAPGSRTVYAAVQCTPDLSEADCEECVGGALRDVQVSFPGRVAVTAFTPNCYLSYANDMFYGVTADDVGLPIPSSSPPAAVPLASSPLAPAPFVPSPSNTVGTDSSTTSGSKLLLAVPIVVALSQSVIFIFLFWLG